MEVRKLEGGEVLEDLKHIRAFSYVYGSEMLSDLALVLDVLEKYYRHGEEKNNANCYYETFVCETKNFKAAWMTFYIQIPTKNVRVYMFAMDKTVPPFVQGKAPIVLAKFFKWYREKKSDYSFSAFATPYSYQIYHRLLPNFTEQEFKLDNYFEGSPSMPAYFLYSSRK